MTYKKDWYKGANYWYQTNTPDDLGGHITTVTFHFPNASIGDYKFTDWLYKHIGDEKTGTNETAIMLQVYIDKQREEDK